MPNLALELEHLDQANRNIANAEAQLHRMKGNILYSPSGRGPHQAYVHAVEAAERSLEAFYAHRNLILQVIQDIQEGRLIDTGKGG
jgi:hypothetical protein